MEHGDFVLMVGNNSYVKHALRIGLTQYGIYGHLYAFTTFMGRYDNDKTVLAPCFGCLAMAGKQ
jgi:hypothetical protein